MERQAVKSQLTTSIEASSKQVLASNELSALFPAGTQIYLTDVGIDTLDTIVEAAARLSRLDYVPVPHIPARRIKSKEALETRLSRLTKEAGVESVLVIAGEADRQMGPFSSSLEVLQTDLLSKHSIKNIGIAGHPEGNAAIPEDMILSNLKAKADFAAETDAQMRIVTQFGFDAGRFISWADALPENGISLPVHMGMAGPAKMTTLIKYAAICGVGPSMSFLRKRGSALASLAMGYDPEPIMQALLAHIAANPNTPIQAAHIFPFGGLKKSAIWLDASGVWDIKKSLYLDANVI